MAKDTFVHMAGRITVDGKTYLPGEPFQMDVDVARHNLRAGVRLLPASAVNDRQAAAARANLTLVDRDQARDFDLAIDDAALNTKSAEDVNAEADKAAAKK
jgi:hypothetical protein